MADAKKLTKLSTTVTSTKLKPQFKVIIENLDKIFTMDNDSVVNICQFFHEFNIEDVLLEDKSFNVEQRKRMVEIVKKEIKNFEKTQKEPVKRLPLHMNDYEFLAEHVIAVVKKEVPEFNYSRTVVKNFIRDSLEFNQGLSNYQDSFVKEFIANTTVSDPFCDKKVRRCFVPYDEILRDKVIFCMKILGLKRSTAEFNLEKNADLWRRQNMIRAFDEFYYPQADEPKNDNLYMKWCELHKKHREEWLKHYEFYYGGNHFKVIKKAGTFTENMGMSQFSYFDCIKKSTGFNDERVALLKQSQEKNKVKNKSEVEKSI